jgi:uncharacterized membrane protein
VLGRLCNGFAACAIGFLALSRCRRGQALTFTALLLPMALSEFASLSQDALIIGLSILAVAVASRVLDERRPARLGEFALFAFVVVATTLARPSQVALALLLPAFLQWRDPGWRAKALLGGMAVAVIAVWLPILQARMPPVPADWSVSGQLHLVLAQPLALPRAMLISFATQYRPLLAGLIGRLGWGWSDAIMPRWYYEAAVATLICALLAPGNRAPAGRPAIIAVATFLCLLMAVCGALYLSWTPVGQATINGLQGRYILPVLPLLAWVVPSYGRRLEALVQPLWCVVILFPLATLAALPGVIMERYYGSWQVMANSLKALLLQ